MMPPLKLCEKAIKEENIRRVIAKVRLIMLSGLIS